MEPFDFGPEAPGQDRDHWLERAEFHLDLGEKTADTRASWSHYQLAGRYLDRAYSDQAAPAVAPHPVMTPELVD